MATLRTISLTAAALLTAASPALGQNREPTLEAVIEPILDRFVQDYRDDPMAIDIVFGVEVEGIRWLVTSRTDGDRRVVDLSPGFDERIVFHFKLDRETLNLLDQGVWNGLTAMGAASSADRTPLDIVVSEGYEKADDYDEVTRRLIFHFWTRGMPEKVDFSPANARVVHGAPASLLYYDKDFRSAVYHIPPGLGREQAPTLSVPFPRMVIVIGGSAEGEIGG